ncbi:mucin TcMUCII, putative, partial [Trypanosoma cruzi]
MPVQTGEKKGTTEGENDTTARKSVSKGSTAEQGKADVGGGKSLTVPEQQPGDVIDTVHEEDGSTTGPQSRTSKSADQTDREAKDAATTTTTKPPNTTTTTTTQAPSTTTTGAPTTTTTRAPSRLREIDGSLSSSAWVFARCCSPHPRWRTPLCAEEVCAADPGSVMERKPRVPVTLGSSGAVTQSNEAKMPVQTGEKKGTTEGENDTTARKSVSKGSTAEQGKADVGGGKSLTVPEQQPGDVIDTVHEEDGSTTGPQSRTSKSADQTDREAKDAATTTTTKPPNTTTTTTTQAPSTTTTHAPSRLR